MNDPVPDFIDVREAAAVAGRSPETVRRWVWSGRLAAHRQGRRLLIARTEFDALIGLRREGLPGSLADWLREVDDRQPASARRGSSAADLVIEERIRRSSGASGRAGR